MEVGFNHSSVVQCRSVCVERAAVDVITDGDDTAARGETGSGTDGVDTGLGDGEGQPGEIGATNQRTTAATAHHRATRSDT